MLASKAPGTQTQKATEKRDLRDGMARVAQSERASLEAAAIRGQGPESLYQRSRKSVGLSSSPQPGQGKVAMGRSWGEEGGRGRDQA